MSQPGQLAAEYQIARGVNTLNERVESLAASVQEMNSRNEERQQFLRQLTDINDEIRRLKNNVGQKEKPIKARKIKPYNGENQTLQSFLTAIELQMENDGVTDDARKIRYVGNYLEGRAWYWFEPIMREKNTKPEDEWSDRTTKVLSNFANMKKVMRQVFGDIDERTMAAKKLQALRQTKSVRDYITEFQMITSGLDWDEEALMDKFKGGLKQNILNLLICFPLEPKSLDELMERAQKIDRETANVGSKRQYQAGYMPRNNNGYHGRFTARNNDSFLKKDRDGDVQMTGAKVDLEKARKERLCFECGKKGHQAKFCKNKKRNQGPMVRMVRAEESINHPELLEEYSDLASSQDSAAMRNLARYNFMDQDYSEGQILLSDSEELRRQSAGLRTEEFRREHSEKESGTSWEVDELPNDLQCNQQRELAIRISEWKKEVEDSTKQPPTLRRDKRHLDERNLMRFTRKRPEGATAFKGSRREQLVPGENEERVDSETPTTVEAWARIEKSIANVDKASLEQEDPLVKDREQKNRLTDTDDASESGRELRACLCYQFNPKCWARSGKAWNQHIETCRKCRQWSLKFCGLHTPYEKRSTLEEISRRKASPDNERVYDEKGISSCQKGWCTHEYTNHRRENMVWRAMIGSVEDMT